MKLRLTGPVVGLLILLGASIAEATITETMFVDSKLPIPPEVTKIVGTVLPESSQVGSSYLSNTYDPNLVISETANVFLTFIHEGAGYRNSLGYFTYETDGTGVHIIDRQLVFPNASYANPNLGWGGGKLSTGDQVTLRDGAGLPRVFQPGERIGFFLVADGWTGSAVRGWNEAAPTLPSESPKDNASSRTFKGTFRIRIKHRWSTTPGPSVRRRCCASREWPASSPGATTS